MYELRLTDMDREEITPVMCKTYSILTDSHVLWIHRTDDVLMYIPLDNVYAWTVKEVKEDGN